MQGEKLYKDIAERTQGDIYIGVVGPVRTGKSTFIKKFMDLLVIPKIDNAYKKERARDELPQSAAGRTIMTTEPKFVPNEAVSINLSDASCKVRLIDCVGYNVEGALGADENGEPRMVQTPWNNSPIPFIQAAEIGTHKVINEHSTIGLVITTDGSITDIDRADYVQAEKRVVNELKAINKPFIIVLNSVTPNSPEADELKKELETEYNVPVVAMSCADLSVNDISSVMEQVLYEFPLREIGITLPSWIDRLDNSHKLKGDIYSAVRDTLNGVSRIRDVQDATLKMNEYDFIKEARLTDSDLGSGSMNLELITPEGLFYNTISGLTGFDISGEDKLLSLLVELKDVKLKYDKIAIALQEVEAKGYGIVSPTIDELTLEEPEIVKQGSRFGVRLKASAPSIHIESNKQKCKNHSWWTYKVA